MNSKKIIIIILIVIAICLILFLLQYWVRSKQIDKLMVPQIKESQLLENKLGIHLKNNT